MLYLKTITSLKGIWKEFDYKGFNMTKEKITCNKKEKLQEQAIVAVKIIISTGSCNKQN